MSGMDATVFNENNCALFDEFSSCTEKATVVKTGILNLIKCSDQWGASCHREYTDPKQTKGSLSKSFCYLFVYLLHS